MIFGRVRSRLVFLSVALFPLMALLAFAQGNESGKLKIHVSPKQAYVFVDGKAIRDGSQTIDLPPGSHEVSVHNYGYVPNTQAVHIEAEKTTDISVALEKSGDKVSGPFGDIEFKGHPRAAVLLNGTTPDYFVGHVDEFDWDWIWHQRLLVKPGTYQVTVTREGTPIWSGSVELKAGEKEIVYLDENGKTKTMDWPQGNTLGAQPRFHAGIASAEVPVARPTAQLTAQSTSLTCGQPTQLNWNSADAVAVSITNLGDVSASGDRSVTPTKTTAYELVAKGPGGEATQTATVDVNTQPTATLTLSQPEVRYHKIGNKVVQDAPITLNWSSSNANQVTITPLGSENASGSRTIEAQPKQTGTGPVNEVIDYTLSASNNCGGTTTQSAALRVVGSIDPAPPITLASIFYPTNYPRFHHPKIGLVAAEKKELSDAADRYKAHQHYSDEHVSLTVVGYADVRGPKQYNQKLSERRAELVKSYLVSQGIPADQIHTRAEGKQQQLSKQAVSQLETKTGERPEKWMAHHAYSTWLAYNRRVDIVLEPAGKQSTVAYPTGASETRMLWQRAEPSLHKVESASTVTTAAASLIKGPEQH